MSSDLKVKKENIERYKQLYQKSSSRRRNFAKLKNGLIKKYVNDELDLKDRQLDSILKLVDPKTDETAISQGYFHACTAFGKTYLMIALAESYRHIESNKKIIIFEERAKVLEQVKKDFIEKTNFTEDDIGAYYGKEKTPKAPIIICTYASMGKLLQEVGQENIGLVLCDEAHHILSENRQKVAENFNYACFYGFTATPEYDKDRDCANVFGEVIDSVTLREGVENGLLCSFKNSLMVSRTAVDLTSTKNSTGEYDAQKLSEILKQSHLTGIREEIANFYLFGEDASIGKLNGKTTIINTPNQEEANELAKTFNSIAGKQIAKAYHTNSDKSVLDEFNRGIFPVLIQVNKISEGYSNPKAEVCINYPTASKVRSAQCSGRVLRSNKENPDKLALIIDICFKKTNSPSVLDEIRANGQVLFMDIAEDVAIITPNLQTKLDKENTPHHTRSTTPKDYYISELFDTYTDIEELYDMRFNQMLSDSTLQHSRERLDTDLGWNIFSEKLTLTQNGKTIPISSKDKEKIRQSIWNKALDEYSEIFIKVRAGSKTIDVIPKENIIKFKIFLQKQGIEILSNIREKLDTDIGWIYFSQNFPLSKNRKVIARHDAEKEKIRQTVWNKALTERPELFIKVRAGNKIINVIPEENITEFKIFLQKQGLETPSSIREKLDTDIGWAYFAKKLLLVKNGKVIATQSADKEKIRHFIWQKTLTERPELFVKVRNVSQPIDAIPEENLIEFKNFLKSQGIEILNQIREKLDTDLGFANFFAKISLTQNGKTIAMGSNDKEKIRQSIWKKAIAEKPNLFVKIKSGSKTLNVLPKENLSDFIDYLNSKGIRLTTSKDELLQKIKQNSNKPQTPITLTKGRDDF